MSKPANPAHWDNTHHGHFKIDPNEGSLVNFDFCNSHGKFTVVQGPPIAPPAADAVVFFAETSNGVPIIEMQPINGAGIAVYQGSLQQAVSSVNPTTLTYATSGGFAFSPNSGATLVIHTNDGHYLAIGDIVQTTGHGHNAAADLHYSFHYAFFA